MPAKKISLKILAQTGNRNILYRPWQGIGPVIEQNIQLPACYCHRLVPACLYRAAIGIIQHKAGQAFLAQSLAICLAPAAGQNQPAFFLQAQGSIQPDTAAATSD